MWFTLSCCIVVLSQADAFNQQLHAQIDGNPRAGIKQAGDEIVGKIEAVLSSNYPVMREKRIPDYVLWQDSAAGWEDVDGGCKQTRKPVQNKPNRWYVWVES